MVTTWATTADVKTYTGLEVPPDLVAQAGAMIDMFAARTYDDAPQVGSRDQYWLKLAVAYQAAWLTMQPDAFQRLQIESQGSASLGGGRATTSYSPDAMLIAPFAKKALSRVSWLKSRSLHTQTSFTDGLGVLGTDPLSSGSDDLYGWDPIE